MPARVLSISYDKVLLHVRHRLLENKGYSVVSVEGFGDALKTCQNLQYDLVVIGHSIPAKDKELILQAIRKTGNTPVIALSRLGEPDLEGVAATVDPFDPVNFVKTIDRILQGKLGRTGLHSSDKSV